MTQEQKELLLKDLCARLPYGVKIKFDSIKETVFTISELGYLFGSNHDIIPYLRPMESMTEEEKKELSILLNYEFYVDDDFGLVAEDDRHRIRLELCEDYIDWLNKKGFDYRGLIPMGLALPAKEGMYN